MKREKNDSQDRRVIVDLSFPDGGTDKHIPQHMNEGGDAMHILPTVDSAVNTIASTCPGDITMAVIDLSRAYRYFPVCPLDWPLLGIVHEGVTFFDRKIPFGARMSSFVMQMVAEFMVRALHTRRISAHMYLDDIVIIAPTADTAIAAFTATLNLLVGLGLQTAQNKIQQPAKVVKCLVIGIDIPNNQLRIPKGKVAQIKRCMEAASGRSTITKRHLQRIIGLGNHLAKIVRAARVFICRIFDAPRAAQTDRINMIKVCPMIKADLEWYKD